MNGLQSNLKRLFDKNCVLACLYLSVCLFVLPQSVIVFFSSVRYCTYAYLSLSLSLSVWLSFSSFSTKCFCLSVCHQDSDYIFTKSWICPCLSAFHLVCQFVSLCLSLVSVCLCLSICLSLSIIVSLKKALVCFHQNLSKIEQEQEILNRRRQ